MQQLPEKNPTIAENIVSAFDVIMGRADMNERFAFTPAGFWQAAITGWVMGVVVIILPSFQIGLHFMAVTILTSLISVLLYALIVWHVLLYSGRSDRFERFLVPYFWIGNLQVVLFGLILILGQMISPALAQIVTIPIVVWILVWLYRTAKRQIGIGTFGAIAFILGRYAVEAGLGLVAAGGIIQSAG